MIYLLTLGWPWFAGACALGALVGFLSFKVSKNAVFSGGWIVLLGVVLLGVGAAVSYMELLEGREAVMFDIGLLASAAYAIGLPIGGVFKSMLGAPATEQARIKASPVVAAWAPVAPPPAAKPATASAKAPKSDPIKVPPLAPAMVSEPFKAAPASAGEAGPAKKAPRGAPPPSLSAPRGGAPDDLTRIKGLGPKSVEKLHALGVYHYDQIAAWDNENARWISAQIGAAGRVERGNWVAQARALSEKSGAMQRA
jgi:predicted flap endonuclease-1-like 5' DNA nuclease